MQGYKKPRHELAIASNISNAIHCMYTRVM